VEALKPRWTTASFLLYAGGFTVLFAAAASLTYLGATYSKAAFPTWSLLVFAVLGALAWIFRRADRWVAAGVFALLAVAAFGVVFASLERWWGWLPPEPTSLAGFHPGRLLLALVVLVASLGAIAIFWFPLLGLLACLAAWFLVTDAVSDGGDGAAIASLFVGVVLLLIGLALDRSPYRLYGFWPHVAAGVAIGTAALVFWHRTDGDWALIGIGAVVFVAVAAGAGRSSWAVLGAIGLLLAGGHFAEEWARPSLDFFDGEETSPSPRWWVPGSVYAFVGFLLVLLGLILDWRQRRAEARPLPPG